MSTTRSIITRNLPNTLTSVYTNTSGGTAVLKSINIDGAADPTSLTTAAGSSEWSFFGSPINPLIQTSATSSANFGIPYPVQLSADRVLLLYLPHFMHQGGANDFMTGNILHSQIVEYTGSTYRAGPIVNVTLPTTVYAGATNSLWSLPASMTGGYGQSNFRAVALSATKVVCAYRLGSAFRMIRLTISGNSVDLSTVANVDLTGASYFNNSTAGAFDLAIVPGATTKVLVAGYTASNWSVQAINIPDSGALSNAGALFSTGITASLAGGCTIAPMAKTAVSNSNAYIFGGATAATNISSLIVTYNSSTDALSVSGTTQTYARNTQVTGVQAVCLSTDATANAVLAMTDTGAPSVINFRRQTSLTQASSAAETTLTLQHATAKSIVAGFKWGDERAVFTGELGVCVVFDSAGTATNLTPATETTNTTRILQQFIPFNSRPLYTLYDPATLRVDRVSQWYSRTSIASATSSGTHTVTGNYFPWGHDYGGHYSWNEQTGTWIVGLYGRLYSINTSGVVADEIPLYQLSTTFNYLYTIKQVQVLPSGKILFAVEYAMGIVPGYNTNTQWTSATGSVNIYAAATNPITTFNPLSRAALSAPILTCTSGMFTLCMTQFQDASGDERAILLYSNTTPNVVSAQFYGSTWYLGSTNSNVTVSLAGAWSYGHRPNLKIIQDTPAQLPGFPTGLWRLLGAPGLNSQSNMGYISITSAPLAATSVDSLNMSTTLSTMTAHGYSMPWRVGPNGKTMVAAMYDAATAFTTIRVFASVDGKLQSPLGFYPTSGNGVNTNLKYPTMAAAKFGYAVGYNNTDSTSNLATIGYAFTANNPNTPAATVTVASGNGTVVINQVDKVRFSIFGASADAVYTQSGPNDTVKFFASIYDGTNDFFINPGQSVLSTENAAYRSNDTYMVPNNYSLKLRCDTQNSLHSLVTIIEEA
jgi:hypothetical protein